MLWLSTTTTPRYKIAYEKLQKLLETVQEVRSVTCYTRKTKENVKKGILGSNV